MERGREETRKEGGEKKGRKEKGLNKGERKTRGHLSYSTGVKKFKKRKDNIKK